MKKKTIAIVAALTLFVASLVMAQISSNAAEMEKEITQVQQDLQAGKITQGEATQRMAEIQQKYLNGTVSDKQQGQSTMGKNAGWPAAPGFRSFQFPVINQPKGTTASFNYVPVSSLEIFIRGGNANTVIQDLVRQVNSGTNSKMNTDSARYTLLIKRSGVVKGDLNVIIEQKDSVVVFSIKVV